MALVLVIGLCSPLVAQQGATGPGNPRVERVRFEGVDALPRAQLQGAIMTEGSRCRGLLLRPFCALTDWNVLVERNFLDPQEFARDEVRLRLFYARRGYREARVSSELRPSRRGVEAVFRIDEGPATRIAEVEVAQTGDVLSGRQVTRAGLPREGGPLDIVQLDTALAHLAARLGERGYLDAVILDTVEVATAERSARIEVRVDPGRRSTVGEIEIRGNRDVNERTITNALRMRPGRVLRTTDIVASQRSLYESNLFHEARVLVPEQGDTAKRVLIEVREAPPQVARLGAGFNTIEFVQTEARYTHYNFFGRGRRFDARAAVGNLLAGQLNDRGVFRDVLPPDVSGVADNPFLLPTWQASVDLMQPAFRAAANTLGASVFAHRRTIPGIVVDRSFGSELSLTRRLADRTPATVSYRFEQTAVEAGDLFFCVSYAICDLPTVDALRERSSLSPLRFALFADRANDPIAPTRGYRTRLDLEHASSFTLSDYRYNRVSGEATRYLPLGVRQRSVVAGRVRAGWVRALESTDEALGVETEVEGQGVLHPRKRFYSGGSRSVRGYGENQLGPRTLTIDPVALREAGCPAEQPIATCDPNAEDLAADAFIPRPIGGTSVIEGSVEYRFPLWGPVQGAVFVDGAIVGERLQGLFSEGRGAVTPGFGGRMQTPVGPIRVDLGLRPTGAERLPVVTEAVGADGVRRLVRLQEQRDYDPLEEAGFFRRTLNRLTLHLSIGEAF